MRRIFGTKKAPAPERKPVDMDSHSQKMDGRMTQLDEKINSLNRELRGYQAQLKKPGNAASKRHIKQRAMQALKRKKLYENQRDALGGRMLNFEGMRGAIDSAKDTREHVDAMRDMAVTLKDEFKEIDVDKVEDMQDEIEDILADSEEIQELMGRDYGMVGDVDEADLDAELAGLEDEVFDDIGVGEDAETTPSYLVPSATADPAVPVGGGGIAEGEPVAEAAAYGLPEAPTTA